MNLEQNFNPAETEKKWYEAWLKSGAFHADTSDNKESYSIVIPPPNVTGSLHMGHALNNTLQDILVRWQRMKGKSVLWMPGMDHAGIATQNVVERLLAKEGKSKHEMSREEFEARVWEWKAESGGTIKGQLMRLGASCDWQRERFTLDEGLSRAVRKVFVELYKEGLIYQGHRIINWCPRCTTALSDIETEYKDLPGKLYHIRYPLKDAGGYITVATTRPETMLGDTGVAVNPDDERYKDLVGRLVILPLVDRPIPIFADAYVDASFGTGLVKVTPAHDPNDFEMGKRHNLEEINILNDNGTINANGGKYAGLDRFEARKEVLADLEALGLLEKIEENPHSVGHCYRCNTIVEPYLSKQWFVKIDPLAKEAIRVVEAGEINFVPSNWAKTYYEWMYNIRDWCISRQLWWGHRIPAFYCADCGEIIVEMEDPTVCPKCGSKNIKQDEDVLDTWFSSGLWPFSTMGWPDNTAELDKYYPTSVLVTGFDIIFFWVARMIMMGMKFMKKVPFRDVYIHALVRDEHGQKMSKSKGNVIDPLVMMDKFGTDAFRFTLAVFAAQGRDVMMSEKRIEGYRSFTNKIWNATKYILMNLGDDFKEHAIDIPALEAFDKWILTSLNRTIAKIEKALQEYKFNDAANAIYEFYWHEFCDWYLELTKPRLYAKENDVSAESARQVLFFVLKNSLKLLHPFMPFITEEIWQTVQPEAGMIITAEWPQVNESLIFEEDERDTELFKEIIYRIRNIRGEMNVPPDRKAIVVIRTKDARARKVAERDMVHIKSLARAESVIIDADYTPKKSDAYAIIGEETEIYLPLSGLIDFDKERARLEKELARLDADLARVNGKLSNAQFADNAPADIVAKERQKLEEMNTMREKLVASLANITAEA